MAFRIEAHSEVTQISTAEDTGLKIMKWGTSNSFPQTVTNLIEQSPTGKPIVARTSKFLRGGIFEGQDVIINQYGTTLGKLVKLLANSYSVFEAFAMQTGFNKHGQVGAIHNMLIPELRFNKFDELKYASKIGYHPNFGRNAIQRKLVNDFATQANIKWFNKYNIKDVGSQIEEIGFDKYNGQVLYHSENGESVYPIPQFQSSINYILADIENSILVRKESSTGFINSYLLKTTMDSEDPSLIALEEAIEMAQGARGNGKVITFSGMSPEDLNATVLEEIGSGAAGAAGVISAAKGASDLITGKLVGSYLIPPILAGMDVNTGFSTEAMSDGYFIFNAITQGGRDTIQSEINRLLKDGNFDIKEIQLVPLKLDNIETQKQ